MKSLKPAKTSFQTQLSLLQALAKQPSRSKTPPNPQKLLQNSKTYVNTTANLEESESECEKTAKNREKPEFSQANSKKKQGFLECNSNSSRRISKKPQKCAENRDFLRLSLENNKNLAWSEISRLLSRTNKKNTENCEGNSKKVAEIAHNFAKNSQVEPKCLVKSSLNFENTKKIVAQKTNLLRKSLNYREDLENVPIVHENFESLVNNYAKNSNISQKNAVFANNLRHSCEGLAAQPLKSEENEKIQSLDGKFCGFLRKNSSFLEKYRSLSRTFEKLQEKNEVLEKEVANLKGNQVFEEKLRVLEAKSQKISMELYLKNEMLAKREEIIRFL